MRGWTLIGGAVMTAVGLTGLGVIRHQLYERTHGAMGAGRAAGGSRPHLTVGFLPVT